MGTTEILDPSLLKGHWLPQGSREAFLRACTRYTLRVREESVDGQGVLVLEKDPLDYAAAVLVALMERIPLFLGNPQWGDTEWKQLKELPLLVRIWGGGQDGEVLASRSVSPDLSPWKKHLMIPTGGTGGKLRFAIHTPDTLKVAARGLHDYTGGVRVRSLCCLPLFHVSGLMQLVRAWASGGTVCLSDMPTLRRMGWPDARQLEVEQISLVPTQVYRLLEECSGIGWLESFRYVWIGGGPLGESLRQRLCRTKIRAYPCYGMTETAAMAAVCGPKSWRLGPAWEACPLPHANCTVEAGEIMIRSAALYRGYFPDPPSLQEVFCTGDEGCIAEGGGFRVFGRKDRFIISGGEKVDPQVVESGIRKTGMVQDILVLGRPDLEWGQRVVAWVKLVPGCTLEALRSHLAEAMAPAMRPREWNVTECFPRLENGKPDWDKIKETGVRL